MEVVTRRCSSVDCFNIYSQDAFYFPDSWNWIRLPFGERGGRKSWDGKTQTRWKLPVESQIYELFCGAVASPWRAVCTPRGVERYKKVTLLVIIKLDDTLVIRWAGGGGLVDCWYLKKQSVKNRTTSFPPDVILLPRQDLVQNPKTVLTIPNGKIRAPRCTALELQCQFFNYLITPTHFRFLRWLYRDIGLVFEKEVLECWKTVFPDGNGGGLIFLRFSCQRIFTFDDTPSVEREPIGGKEIHSHK